MSTANKRLKQRMLDLLGDGIQFWPIAVFITLEQKGFSPKKLDEVLDDLEDKKVQTLLYVDNEPIPDECELEPLELGALEANLIKAYAKLKTGTKPMCRYMQLLTKEEPDKERMLLAEEDALNAAIGLARIPTVENQIALRRFISALLMRYYLVCEIDTARTLHLLAQLVDVSENIMKGEPFVAENIKGAILLD